MSDARIIEIDDEAAGIVVEDEQGVRFFAAMRAYFAFEGVQFRNAREAERALSRFATQRRRFDADKVWS
jgi:hypothetical protein